MRHRQPRLVHDRVAVHEQVEVDGSRPPPRNVARPAQRTFDLEQPLQECPRLEARLDLGYGIQEARLIRVPPGLRLDDRGHAPRAELLRRRADRRFAVAEVRPQPHVRAGHGRSTVTPLNSTVIPAGFTCGFRTRTFTCSIGNRAISSSATVAPSASRSWKRRSLTLRMTDATSR